MTNQEKKWIDSTRQFILQKFEREASGHDFWHLQRVVGLAMRLQSHEGGNLFIICMTAWLHDIADWKFHQGDESQGPKQARQWLEDLAVAQGNIEDICSIIANLSFKGALVAPKALSIEGKIVQDADRLDAMGAVGIARTFAYGGHAGSPIYDPQKKPTLHDDAQAYVQDRSHTINHFHEKLLLLKDRLNTATAQQWAQQRHARLEQFLFDFMEEWNFSIPRA